MTRKHPAAPPLLARKSQRQYLIDSAVRPSGELFQCIFKPSSRFEVVEFGVGQQALDRGGAARRSGSNGFVAIR
jgi:hypothetical protein